MGVYGSVDMRLRRPGLASMWPVDLFELWYPALSSTVMILPTSPDSLSRNPMYSSLLAGPDASLMKNHP